MKIDKFDLIVQKKLLFYFNCLLFPRDLFNKLEIQVVLKKHLIVQKRLRGKFNEKLGAKIIATRKKLPNDEFKSLEQLSRLTSIDKAVLEDLSIFWSPPYCTPCRNIYLKIEKIDDYSPVDPQIEKPLPPVEYRRDCLRMPGHENAKIPEDEVQARAVDAVIFREYEDADYLLPKTYKLINADINEPIFDRRVPGAVIYAYPNERLCIHVYNDHNQPHSFHIHGLEYGPDSDGTYPLGTQSSDGRRSDEICPKQSWTYIFDVTKEMIGCWPFHSHYRNSATSIKLGLFGGLIVLQRRVIGPKFRPIPKGFIKNDRLDIKTVLGKNHNLRTIKNPVIYDQFLENIHEWVLGDWARPRFTEKIHHAPVFLHVISSDQTIPIFTSGDLEENTGIFEHVFEVDGDFNYFCEYHPNMTGTIQVVVGAPNIRTVNIEDAPDMGFYPQVIDISPGGTIRWENHSSQHHTVTSTEGANIPTHCLNGRGFLGNTPTIEANSGERIRWYVFNLDTGHEWHNFHLHNARWTFAGESIDVRSIGPAESFCFETDVPDVILLDKKIKDMQRAKTRPGSAKKYTFAGEFIFHCHVHHHFMNGMVGMVRAKHTLWLTPDMACELMKERGLKLYNSANRCTSVDLKRCKKQGGGTWEDIPGDPRVAMMHSCLLPGSSKLLYFGYEARYSPNEREYAWLWDPIAGYQMTANQPDDITPGGFMEWSLWSGEHSFLNDLEGTILIHGGYRNNVKKAYLFNPSTEQWSVTTPTSEGRFYATTITLSDGKVMTLFGSNLFGPGGTSTSMETYDPVSGTWSGPVAFPMPDFDDHQFYPWTFQLPDGQLFVAGPHVPTHKFDPANAAVNTQFATVHGNRSSGGEKGTAVLLTLRPPNYEEKVIIIGGNIGTTPGTSEIIDLSVPSPAWTSPAYMALNEDRSQQCHSVILPDGKIFICGGISSGGDGGPCEILDPDNITAGWQRGPVMKYPRTYHSSAILMADGSVIAGGDPESGGSPTPHEQFKPYYFNLVRPDIINAPNQVDYNINFDIGTPQGNDISEVVLMRPGAVTHGWNMTQRRIELLIDSQTASTVQVTTPANGFIAPPGWYLLFILDMDRIPSTGTWIRLTA